MEEKQNSLLNMAGCYILQRYKNGEFKNDFILSTIHKLLQKDYFSEQERVNCLLDCMNEIEKYRK